jgi:hypothetical protein
VIALLALAAAVQTAPVPDEQPDIVVIGKRLQAVQVNVGRDPRGRFTCALSQSTGSAKLDGQLCKTAATCVRKGAVEAAAVSACIDARKPALLDDLHKSLGKVGA